MLVSSCGSNWTITGNSINIQKVENDSVLHVKAGSYILTEE